MFRLIEQRRGKILGQIANINCYRHFVYEKKNCQYLYQKRKVRLCVRSETLNVNNFRKICVTLQWQSLSLLKGTILIGDPFHVTTSFLVLNETVDKSIYMYSVEKSLIAIVIFYF